MDILTGQSESSVFTGPGRYNRIGNPWQSYAVASVRFLKAEQIKSHNYKCLDVCYMPYNNPSV
jgi:hypothetical protein